MPDSQPLALLADRDQDTLDLYTSVLSMAAWRTEQATDGASALVKALQLQPDTIVTETWLPVVDGIRLIRILKADAKTAAIPIVALTADPRETEISRARAAGCDAVLIKPCAPEQLLQTISRLRADSCAPGATSPDVRARAQTAPGHAVDVQVRARRKSRAVSLKTTEPELPPPALHCPVCAANLQYEFSYIGGVSTHREQWDYLRCPSGCGEFQYRHRTRRVRMV